MNKIVYILPSIGISGGVAIVLQHVNRLIALGHDVSILVINEGDSANWFPDNRAVIFRMSDIQEIKMLGVDIVIATHFSTVKTAQSINARRKIYFVQSDERRFNLNAKEFLCCEETYSVDMEFMTEALWIQRWLKEEFKKDAYYVPNGLDTSIFYPTENIKPKTKVRVLLEGSIDVPFKGMQDAYDAVKDLDCELWIVSNRGVPRDDWRCDRFFSCVPFFDMNTIYSSCDILLKMSNVEGFFGPPMEAMACGCSVVISKVTGYDEYIKNDYNALVVDKGDISSAKIAVSKLIQDTNLRNTIIKNGYETAQKWGWDKSIALLENVIHNKAVNICYTASFPERYTYDSEIKNIMIGLLKKNVSLGDSYYELEKSDSVKDAMIQQKEDEINVMKESKFWKLRNSWLLIKSRLKFFKK